MNLRRVRRRSKIRPYPAQYERSIDPVDKLGLQDALGAGKLEAYYLRGAVSYQTVKLPFEVRDAGKLGESQIIIRPVSRTQIEYQFGTIAPIDSVIKPQEEILEDIVGALGLERKEEALGISIKERLTLHKVNKLSRELQDAEPPRNQRFIPLPNGGRRFHRCNQQILEVAERISAKSTPIHKK